MLEISFPLSGNIHAVKSSFWGTKCPRWQLSLFSLQHHVFWLSLELVTLPLPQKPRHLLNLNEFSTQFASATSSLFGGAKSGQHILFEPISEWFSSFSDNETISKNFLIKIACQQVLKKICPSWMVAIGKEKKSPAKHKLCVLIVSHVCVSFVIWTVVLQEKK